MSTVIFLTFPINDVILNDMLHYCVTVYLYVQARCRMLMAECEFDDQNRAQMVLELMEEVENDENNYPLHYYVDAAHDFDNLQSASEFLFKECPIQGFCAGDKVPIHEVQCDVYGS